MDIDNTQNLNEVPLSEGEKGNINQSKFIGVLKIILNVLSATIAVLNIAALCMLAPVVFTGSSDIATMFMLLVFLLHFLCTPILFLVHYLFGIRPDKILLYLRLSITLIILAYLVLTFQSNEESSYVLIAYFILIPLILILDIAPLLKNNFLNNTSKLKYFSLAYLYLLWLIYSFGDGTIENFENNSVISTNQNILHSLAHLIPYLYFLPALYLIFVSFIQRDTYSNSPKYFRNIFINIAVVIALIAVAMTVYGTVEQSLVQNEAVDSSSGVGYEIEDDESNQAFEDEATDLSSNTYSGPGQIVGVYDSGESYTIDIIFDGVDESKSEYYITDTTEIYKMGQLILPGQLKVGDNVEIEYEIDSNVIISLYVNQ